jgi:hypothetical protein
MTIQTILEHVQIVDLVEIIFNNNKMIDKIKIIMIIG